MFKKLTSQTEFVALMAALMSVTALSIDALLPALDIIGDAIHIEKQANNQLLVTMIFLGLGVVSVIVWSAVRCIRT